MNAATPPQSPPGRPVKLVLTQPIASPRRALGQCFLQDLRVVAAAVSAASVTPGELVLEVGPGTGVLTRALLAAGATVFAVEKDVELAKALQDNNAALCDSGRLTVVSDDALRWLRSPAAEAAFPAVHTPGRRAKVVANIPYASACHHLVQRPARCIQF